MKAGEVLPVLLPSTLRLTVLCTGHTVQYTVPVCSRPEMSQEHEVKHSPTDCLVVTVCSVPELMVSTVLDLVVTGLEQTL